MEMPLITLENNTLYQSRVCKQAKNIYNIIANRLIEIRDEHKTQILVPDYYRYSPVT